ncbi:MAG TPA: ABC-2 family transporter protein [Bdellovibrionales bacterium]|nr:ABC-2 family transporter protein [Bdellovibrionales bacterium]
MRRYFKVWSHFFRMSWMADLEYRVNIVMRVIGELFWYLMQLSVFEVLYSHTNTISGWDVNDMRVFMGCLFTVDVLYMIFIQENLDHLWSVVRKGDLDLYLTKPINSQFMVSCRKVSVSYFINLVLVVGYLIWAMSRVRTPPEWTQLVALPFLLICGWAVAYALRFLFCSLTIILQDAGNVQFIWHQFYRLGTRPDPLYPRALRRFVLMVFPLGFFASVPSRVIVEGVEPRLLVAAPLMAAGLVILSNVVWEAALKHYASASS